MGGEVSVKADSPTTTSTGNNAAEPVQENPADLPASTSSDKLPNKNDEVTDDSTTKQPSSPSPVTKGKTSDDDDHDHDNNNNNNNIPTLPVADDKSIDESTDMLNDEVDDDKSSSGKSGSSKDHDGEDEDDEGEEDDIPGVNREDVLIGRPGSYPRNRKANKRYWNCVLQQVPMYPKVIHDKEAQYDLARHVIQRVKNNHGGRFMEYENDGWVLADVETTLNKVRRAIKEKWERSQLRSKKRSREEPVTTTTTTATPEPDEKLERSKSSERAKKSDNKHVELNNMDVILFFGHSHHEGNKLYWSYVLKEAVPKFGDIVEDKDAQFDLARQCIDFVEKKNGGRFVQPAAKNMWELVQDDTVLFKVRRAIKERWERKHKSSPTSTPERNHDEAKEIEVRPMDVFLGRPVSGQRSHEGTELYWEFLTKQVPIFGRLLGDREAQFELAGKVVDYIVEEQGGRFLEMDEDGNWDVASETVALEKTRRAIREKWEKHLTTGGSTIDDSMGTPKPQDDPDDQPDVKPTDVLIGKSNNSRVGNQRYWDLVLEQVPNFTDIVDDKDAQFEMAQKVIDVVKKENGGRFLEFDEEDGLWKVGDEVAVLQKVRRAIKEKWERETKKGKHVSSSNKKKSKGGGSVDSRSKQPSQEISTKRAKVASKIVPKVVPPKRKVGIASEQEQLVQLTHDIVDILKGEKKAVLLEQLRERVDAEMEDVEAVCESLSELGMIHVLREEEIKQHTTGMVSKVVWWEYAGTFLKRKSWEMMPLGEDTEHVMRSEMSLLVREEARLDVWISRMRNLMSNPRDPEHLYVTPSDVIYATNLNSFPPTSSPAKKLKRTQKDPVVAIHAPFGSVLQSSTPVSYQRNSAARTRQLVITSERPSPNDDPIERKDPLQVYFFPNSDRWKNYVLSENPVLEWIREPRYTSETNFMGGAGDNLHVSCLREDEGVSSFF